MGGRVHVSKIDDNASKKLPHLPCAGGRALVVEVDLKD
jgi:hypothetical protein